MGLGAAKAKKGNINAIVATEPVIDDFSIDDLSLQMNNLRKDEYYLSQVLSICKLIKKFQNFVKWHTSATQKSGL